MRKILNFLKKVWTSFLDFLFPPLCLGCSSHVRSWGEFCPECWASTVFIVHPFCDRCGVPFDIEVDERTLCVSCLTHPKAFSKVRSCFLYNDISKKIVLSLKNHDKTQLAPYMAKFMEQSGKDLIQNADIVTIVPLHWRRLFKRKFNQAALILRYIKTPGIKIYDLLQRTKNTKYQGSLHKDERAKNVKKSFAFTDEYKNAIRGKTVLIIDDVITTGSTLHECAKILIKSGAKEVWGLSWARTKEHFYKD